MRNNSAVASTWAAELLHSGSNSDVLGHRRIRNRDFIAQTQSLMLQKYSKLSKISRTLSSAHAMDESAAP